MPGLIGKKIGMSSLFDDAGVILPCTVVEAGPCAVVQVKTEDRDGYRAVQLGFESRKDKHSTRAARGHGAVANLEAAPAFLREFPVSDDEAYELGQSVTVEVFEVGDKVKVTGTSKGKGFQGVMKRHGFAGRPATHGHSGGRNPGSMGPGTDPSRVIKGKKLPGQMGGKRRTVANLEVVRVDPERNLLFIKGAVPGSRGSLVLIKK